MGWRRARPISTCISPDLALSQGRSLHCSSSPLSESALIYSSVLSKEIYIVCIPSGSRVAEATHALRSFSVHYINFSHQTVFTCLGVSLKLIMHFHLTMKIIYIFIYIIYYVEKDIRLYIIYIIQEPLGIFSRVKAQCYLSSSEEVEVVSCWEQPQSCSSFKECHFRIRVGVRMALPSRRRICGSSFLLDSFRLERPDANGPGLLRACPSG